MILVVDDDVAVRTSLALLLKQAGYAARAVSDPASALRIASETPPDLALIDMNYSLDTSGQDGLALLAKLRQVAPATAVILITGWGSISLAVEGMKAGAAEFITKPWNNEALLQTIRTVLDLRAAHREAREARAAPPTTSAAVPLLPNGPTALPPPPHAPTTPSPPPEALPDNPTRRQLDRQFALHDIVGQNEALLQVLRSVGQVAPTDASVLIEGESGTGKELIAEALHRNSKRRRGPFVKVNLGGISQSLFESELFGHRKGAFTDAKTDRVGRFELAQGGTIFLDEIGELDLASQVKLLRVLQDRTYEVLGDSKPRQLDIRVVCATNRNLAQLVREGRFREDLFYRINLITVRLPALRERADDIPLLVNHFIQGLRQTYGRPALSVGTRGLHWLRELPLPGNIRELKNLVERAVLISGCDTLGPEEFQAHFEKAPVKSAGNEAADALPAVGTMTLDELEAVMIRRSVDFYGGNLSRVARALGLSRQALYRRLEKYEIPFNEE